MHTFLVGAVCLAGGFVLGLVFDGRVIKAIKAVETSILTEVARVRTRMAAVEAAVKGRV